MCTDGCNGAAAVRPGFIVAAWCWNESRLVPNMAGSALCDVGGSCEEDSSELLPGKVRRPISRPCVRAYTHMHHQDGVFCYLTCMHCFSCTDRIHTMSMIRTVCSSRSLRDKEARPHQGVWVELGWDGGKGGVYLVRLARMSLPCSLATSLYTETASDV